MTAHGDRDELAALWAIRLSEQDLSEADQVDFQAWLDSDARNVDILSEIIGAWQAVDRYAAADPMMELREDALARARQIREQTRESPAVSRGPAWMLVAACLCLIAIGFSIWQTQQPEIYSTGLGERRIVLLDDDSRLSLDAGTRVRVKYTTEGRKFWLEQGRAKFSVAKNPLRPFSVAARGKLVVATGTEFSVELVGPETRVILYEGHVAVLDGQSAPAVPIATGDKNPDTDASYLTLDPGQELVVTNASAAKAKPKMQVYKASNPAMSADWEAGMLVFDNETLAIVAERTNRYAEKPLKLADARVGQMRISGVFRAGDTADLVEGLSATLGVKARAQGREIILSAPNERTSR